jgi:hypothetical protein
VTGKSQSSPRPDAHGRLLVAFAACGRDQYRADADNPGTFRAYCPGCGSHLVGVRRLTIRERDGVVTMACSTGCTQESIVTALKVAERTYPLTWSGETPADVGAVADLLHERGNAERELVRSLQWEAC